MDLIHGRAALIVSECQRGVIERGTAAFPELVEQVEERGIVPRIAALAACFRAAGHPVVHAVVAHRRDLADLRPNTLLAALARKHGRMMEGTDEVAIVAPLAPQAEDLVLVRSSGLVPFNGTALDATARRMGIETVVLAGVSTNVAIAGCALSAADLGYRVVIAEDCIAGADPASHAAIVQTQLRMVARIARAHEVATALGHSLEAVSATA